MPQAKVAHVRLARVWEMLKPMVGEKSACESE